MNNDILYCCSLPYWISDSIGAVNNLLLGGKQPLPKPTLTSDK